MFGFASLERMHSFVTLAIFFFQRLNRESHLFYRDRPDLALSWLFNSEGPQTKFASLETNRQLAVLTAASSYQAAMLLQVGKQLQILLKPGMETWERSSCAPARFS